MRSPEFYSRIPISGRGIRLLSIHPAADTHERVECHCQSFELHATIYEALSYVWGDQQDETEILCNGEVITVGSSLANALVRLRRADSARLVWVDAICIDQHNRSEKNDQVPLMGEIYSMARRVVVWLGHDDRTLIEQTLGCVKAIANGCRRLNLLNDTGQYRGYGELPLSSEMFSDRVHAGLRKLYENAWFKRVWCIQEIRLSQAAMCLWGGEEVPWEDIGLAASWITYQHERDGWLKLSTAVRHADILFDPDLVKEALLETLRTYREWESGDPRDKVYGLLSLVGEPPEINALNMDYNKTAGRVFADTVLVDILLYGELTGLACVLHDESYDGEDERFPSWAPRWDNRKAFTSWATMRGHAPWNACDGRLMEQRNMVFSDPRVLHSTGVVYERITEVSAVVDDDIIDPRHLGDHGAQADEDLSEYKRQALAHPIAAAINRVNESMYFPSSQDTTRDLHDPLFVLARTLTNGEFKSQFCENFDHDVAESFYQGYLNLVNLLHHWHTGNPAYKESGSTFGTYDFQFRVNSACLGRRLFWMSNGDFGLGPGCMRSGDIVVVLYGGKIPYVLRPKGDAHMFVGYAYVDRIMHGEVVQELRGGLRHEQEFCII